MYNAMDRILQMINVMPKEHMNKCHRTYEQTYDAQLLSHNSLQQYQQDFKLEYNCHGEKKKHYFMSLRIIRLRQP